MHIPFVTSWTADPPPRRDVGVGEGMQIVDRVEKDAGVQAARQEVEQAKAAMAVLPARIEKEYRRSNSDWTVPVLAAPLVAGMGMLAVPVPAVQLAGLAVGILGPPVALLVYVTLRHRSDEERVTQGAARVEQAGTSYQDTRRKVAEREWDRAMSEPPPGGTDAGKVESGEQTVRIGGVVVPRKQAAP